MNEENILEPNEVCDQLVSEAIKRDYGICRDLYHGTSKYEADKIRKTAEIKIGSEYGYLGRGIYCYLHDVEASRIWARIKNRTGKIAVFKLVANLGNIFYICQELHRIFYNKATKHKEIKLAVNEKVGYIIELFIKQIIIPDYDIDIHTVGRSYMLKKKRSVLMYSLHDKLMVKKIELCWEGQ